jgi:intracellular sulfur oxidation DsrE/DsrF family protein
MRLAAITLALMGLVSLTLARGEEPVFSYLLIKGYGGVVSLPNAAEQPTRGAKVVFDITVDSSPGEVNRGLESVARYLNLGAQAGNRPGDCQLTLVIHGGATKCALTDEAYQRHAQAEHNPNLPLLLELKQHGVEIFVCGQSLARNKFPVGEVAGPVTVAASAMSVNVNKQLAGYAYLAVH